MIGVWTYHLEDRGRAAVLWAPTEDIIHNCTIQPFALARVRYVLEPIILSNYLAGNVRLAITGRWPRCLSPVSILTEPKLFNDHCDEECIMFE